MKLDPRQEIALRALNEQERKLFKVAMERFARSLLDGSANTRINQGSAGRTPAGAEPSAVRSTPGVMGGDACIEDTRIPVWLLVAYKSSGVGDAEILRNYPGLTPADLGAAWAFDASDPRRVEGERRRHERDEP